MRTVETYEKALLAAEKHSNHFKNIFASVFILKMEKVSQH